MYRRRGGQQPAERPDPLTVRSGDMGGRGERGSQRLNGGLIRRSLPERLDQRLIETGLEAAQDLVLGGVVPKECAPGHSDRAGDVVDRDRVVPVLEEQSKSGAFDLLLHEVAAPDIQRHWSGPSRIRVGCEHAHLRCWWRHDATHRR